MNRDIVIGLSVLCLAMGFITYIFIWSRKVINRIKEKDLHSARSIMKEINGKK